MTLPYSLTTTTVPNSTQNVSRSPARAAISPRVAGMSGVVEEDAGETMFLSNHRRRSRAASGEQERIWVKKV